jgi:hypothetical protein
MERNVQTSALFAVEVRVLEQVCLNLSDKQRSGRPLTLSGVVKH